jgi:alkylmercury lyase
MTTTPHPDLPTRLTDTAETGLDAGLLVPLLRLLADGEPVPIARLAQASGRPEGDVHRALAAVPDTEYDQDGRIVGQGLTLRPTRHRFTVDGENLYTWCALDTLMFPAVLGKAATIESTSPASGEPIRVTVAADGSVTAVEPTSAVVSLVSPEDMAEVRSSFCNQVHYFTSPEDAQPWLEAHPEGEVLTVEQARRMGADIVTAFLGSAAPTPSATPGCCGPAA